MNKGCAAHRYGTARYWTRDDAHGTWDCIGILSEPEKASATGSEPGCQEATMAEAQADADTDDDVSLPSALSSETSSKALGEGPAQRA